MTAVPPPTRMTPEEFIFWERQQDGRHEFFNGEVFSQAGGTRNHSLIGTNTARVIGNLLAGDECEAHGSDMRILIEATGYQAYPDVSVACPPIEGPEDDLISNPVLVVEVLSPSTADFGRGGKFDHYRQIPSLREYLIIWQDQPQVEQRIRREEEREEEWLLRTTSGIDQSIQLESIEGSLSLASIFDKVNFA